MHNCFLIASNLENDEKKMFTCLHHLCYYSSEFFLLIPIWKSIFESFFKQFKQEIGFSQMSQQHILGFATSLYNYILIKKDICN